MRVQRHEHNWKVRKLIKVPEPVYDRLVAIRDATNKERHHYNEVSIHNVIEALLDYHDETKDERGGD